jgi:polyhydroxyalkanoate synthesis regulator phasin
MTEEHAGICDRARKLGNEALHVGRGAWLVGLGALAVTEEQARSMVDRLRTKGEQVENGETGTVRQACRRVAGRAKRLGAGMEERARQAVNAALHRAGVPSHDELRDLIDRVEKLTAKLDRLAADR